MRPWLIVLVALLAGCQAPAPTPTPLPAPTAAPTPIAVTSARIETLNAANAAFTAGDLQTAIDLYERVLNTPPAGEGAGTAGVIDDFADFRALVTLLAAGREDDARSHVDALQKRDPNATFARLATQLWDQYGMVGALRGACAQLQPQVATQAGAALSALQGLGVSVDQATLCTPGTR